ncbi:MAG: S8 family serine peptidase [Chitinophagaceae bacterium]|nr:S8 family serine peptidase [Chitinophagaceae bacterium]
MRKNQLLILVAVAMIYSSCKKEINLDNGSGILLHMPHTDRGLIVIAKEGENISNISSAVRSLGGKELMFKDIIKELGLIIVQTPDPGFAEKARSIAGVEAVAVDVVTNWRLPERFEKISKAQMASATKGKKPVVNNNPYSFLQWGIQSVNADKAWQRGYAGKGAKVAVLDGGFILGDSEIAPNIILTHSFIDGEMAAYAAPAGFSASHGTHVAGTIAAANDGEGVIGIAPEAKLILVKVLSDETGSGPWSSMINGIYYAAVNDADVINMSLGGELPRKDFIDDNGTPDDPSDDMLVSYNKEIKPLINAMNRATVFANLKGVTVFAAAGNDGYNYDVEKDFITYPANCLGVLAIASNGPLGWGFNQDTTLYVPSVFTNSGKKFISYGAPGGNYNLPLSNAVATVGGITNYEFVFNWVFNIGGIDTDANELYYVWEVGTSMATPHASAVAALLYGKYGKRCSPFLVDQILRASAKDLGAKGNDRFFGQGQINAGKAVSY